MHSRERFEGRNLFDFYKKSNKFRAHYKPIVEQSCAFGVQWVHWWVCMALGFDVVWRCVSILLFLVQDGF